MKDNKIALMNKANIYVYWFTVIIILGYFDGMIVNSKWPFLANVRTIIYLSLFVVVFCKYRLVNFKKSLLLTVLGVYLLFVGLLHSGEYSKFDYSGLNYWLKNIFQLILIYCFMNYESLTNRRLESLFPTILKVAIVWCMLNFLFYFFDFPIWGSQRRIWWGRIACGYPTVDVITLNFSLIILLFGKVAMNPILRLVFATMFVISILGQASGIGSFILFCTTVVFIYRFIFNDGLNFKRLFGLVITFFVIVLLLNHALRAYKNYDRAMYDDAITILTDKFYGIIGRNDMISTYDTMEMRKEVAERSMQHLKTFQDKLFGLGFANLDYSGGRSALSSRYVMIENQYMINLYTIGYVGNLLFLFAIYLGVAKAFIQRIEGAFFICVLFFMYALSGLTTTTFVSFPIQVVFGIIYTLQISYRKRHV